MNIYEVEFMQYTNGMRDAVWNEESNKYISINREGFVARECDLDYLKEFGKGFRRIKFVGQLFEQPNNKVELDEKIIINNLTLSNVYDVSELIKKLKECK